MQCGHADAFSTAAVTAKLAALLNHKLHCFQWCVVCCVGDVGGVTLGLLEVGCTPTAAEPTHARLTCLHVANGLQT